MNERAGVAPAARRGAPAAIAWVGLALLAAWLLAPALTSNHVEGYTAALQMNAIAANRGLIDRADLLAPVQTEYLHLTRQGVELLLRGLMRATGRTDDALFRGLTLASLGVFLAATVVVARRHGATSWRTTLAALLLLPGVVELGFYFNDGIVAAAFGTAGLALWPPARGATCQCIARAAGTGACLAAAVLCRSDGLLMLPLALGLTTLAPAHAADPMRHGAALPPRRPALARDWAVLTLGMAVVFAAADAATGTSLFQALRVGRDFDLLHREVRWFFVRGGVFVLFFGLPGLAFVALGVARVWRGGGWRRRLALLGLPGTVVLYGLHSATELRQVYPFVAPFAVLLCATGIDRTRAALSAGPGPRRRAVLLLTASAAVWLLPPVFVPVKDGPRPVVGRLWATPMWLAWQGRVATSLADVAALVDRAGRVDPATGAGGVQPPLVVISAHFNSEHWLQLRAWQAGWVPLRAIETAARCPASAEFWSRGGRTLVQVRLDDPYRIAAIDADDFAALRLQGALGCAALRAAPVFVSDFFPPLSDAPTASLLRQGIATTPPLVASFAWPAPLADRIAAAWGWRSRVVPLGYGANRSAPVDAETLASVVALARQRLADRAAAGVTLPADADALLPRLRTRQWSPPVSALPPGHADPALANRPVAPA